MPCDLSLPFLTVEDGYHLQDAVSHGDGSSSRTTRAPRGRTGLRPARPLGLGLPVRLAEKDGRACLG